MNNVFVTKGLGYSVTDAAVAVTTLATVDTLGDGALAFFQEDGVKVLDAGTFVKTGGIVNLYMGKGLAQPQHCRINLDTLTYTKKAYTTPVAQTIYLGFTGATGTFNLNAVTRALSYYGITFTDLSKEVYENTRKTSLTLTTLNDNITSATLVAALVAAINANDRIMGIIASCTAVGTTGIVFVGKADIPFAIQGVGLLESSTVTDTQAFVPTGNSTAWAKVLEFDESTIEGRSSALPPEGEMNPLYTVPSRVAASANYTVYTLNSCWLRPGYPSANANAQEADVTILVPAANTGLITSLDNILLNLKTKYVAPAV